MADRSSLPRSLLAAHIPHAPWWQEMGGANGDPLDRRSGLVHSGARGDGRGDLAAPALGHGEDGRGDALHRRRRRGEEREPAPRPPGRPRQRLGYARLQDPWPKRQRRRVSRERTSSPATRVQRRRYSCVFAHRCCMYT